MRITYDGPHAAVDVLDLGRTVKNGETVDVDEPLASQLVAQGWKPAPAPKTAKAAKKEDA